MARSPSVSFLIQLFSGVAIGCIYGLVAIGFSMIYRAMGLVNFAQGDIVMLGAFVGYTILTISNNLPFVVVILLAMLVTGLFGAAIERLAFRPRMLRNASQIYLVLLTLGIGIVLSNAARLIWGANPVVYNIPLSHEVLHIAGYPLPMVHLYIVATMAILLLGLQFFFTRSWAGLALRAVSEDRDTAQLMGIDTGHASTLAFAVASAIGAAAGVLYAPIFYVSFDMGLIGIKAFAASVVGSFGNVLGAVIGGLVIGLSETIGAQLIATEYQDSIAFATMILVLLVRPNGLLGKGVRA
ncbi:MAG: branched-chain amino acid ABC transporter permease [Pseudomonadota bacterium]